LQQKEKRQLNHVRLFTSSGSIKFTVSNDICTRLKQPPAICQGRAVTSFLLEPLEDMAVSTDTGVTLTSFSGCTSFRF